MNEEELLKIVHKDLENEKEALKLAKEKFNNNN
jgi:hypothetical protein